MTLPPSSLRVEIAATLDAIAPEWAALEARTPEATGFQSFAWCRRWLEVAHVAGASCKPRVVMVRENGRLVALWPLQIESFFCATVARWIGEPMTQYGDILAEQSEGREQWRQAVDAELSRWRDVDLFAFTRLRADGVLAGLGPPIALDVGSMSAPFVDLGICQGRRIRRHKSAERRAKRLATFGELRFAEILDPNQREEVARSAIAMKIEWLRSKRRFSPTCAESRVEFRQINALVEKSALHFLQSCCGPQLFWRESRFENENHARCQASMPKVGTTC